MTAPAGHRFVSWARRGLSAALPGTTGPGGRMQLPVSLTVQKGSTATEDLTRTLQLYGPGDVVRLDSAQIIRREPPPGTSDFEPNYFPLVEFDAPELPWLVTPEQGGERLRPWLTLVVLPRELGRVATDPRRPLPWLSLAPATARDELPDLADAWAWAHVQITGTTAPPSEALDGRMPETTLSRILCARRLRPREAYLACLVPTYRAGLQAGLGQTVSAGAEPAWPPPGGWGSLSGPFELPVYDHWEFATGDTGDFEDLVRRLRPHAVGPDVGGLAVDISDAGPEFDDLALPSPSLLPFEGALASPSRPQRQWPPGAQAPFAQRIEELIEVPPGVDTTVLRPPIYGSFQAGLLGELPDAGGTRPWMRDLNLDPGWRSAAALGVSVVQQLQEQFMASAWDQAGELDRANTLLRQAQLARATAAATRAKHLDGLPPDTAVRLTEPVHSRVRLGPDGVPPDATHRRTLRGSVDDSVFPQAALSPPFRRALRPVGPLGRRLFGDPQQAATELSEALSTGELRVPLRPARGGADFDEVGAPRFRKLREELPAGAGWRKVAGTEADGDGFYVGDDPYGSGPAGLAAVGTAAPARMASALIAPALPRDDWEVEERGRRADRLVRINDRFKLATEFLLQHLPTTVGAPPPAGPPLDLAPVADALATPGGALEPDRTVAGEVLALLPPAGGDPDADPLRPRAVVPRFPQPMSTPLASVDGRMLLPGADGLAPDSVGVVVGNPRFIEAYMVGLNHELSRELLWRGLPTDLAATFADRFWDERGSVGGATPPQLPAIADWDGGLGANATGVGGPGMLVLIIRGRLLQRYPHTAVYAVRAVAALDGSGRPLAGPGGAPVPTLGPEELHPQFRGTIAPDITYLGFDLSLGEARGEGGGLGWFFVIQEQPTAPRFGLDEPGAGPPTAPASWAELDWADVVPAGTDPATARYAGIAGPLATPARTLPVLGGRPQPTATWAADSSQMAAITWQRPMRVAIHARTALPSEVPT